MTQVFIVLLQVDNFDRLKDANPIENQTFESWEEFWAVLKKRNPDAGRGRNIVLTYTQTEFMEACNDQIINLEYWWLTYINMNAEAV